MTEPTDITFEAGYKRLEEIAERVNSESVSVDEMCDLFAEGKGLDKALTEYLEQQKGRIERIERGEEIQAFRIRPSSERAADSSAGSDASAERAGAAGSDSPAAADALAGSDASAGSHAPAGSDGDLTLPSSADDDIPF